MNIQMAGIRNVNDALMCVDCGVNINGLLVGQAHTSDDFISKELAKCKSKGSCNCQRKNWRI
jgi:hypothetical protein